jgi:phage gp36-like protein
MATYATNDEVVAEFKSLDITSSGAAINATKIQRFREEAYAYIHARIGNKYETPVESGSDAEKVLKQIEIWLVKHRIQQIIPVRTGAEGAKQGDTKPDLEKKAEAVLEQILEGKMKLDGAELLSSADGVASFNVSEGTEHTVKKDEDQW